MQMRLILNLRQHYVANKAIRTDFESTSTLRPLLYLIEKFVLIRCTCVNNFCELNWEYNKTIFCEKNFSKMFFKQKQGLVLRQHVITIQKSCLKFYVNKSLT